MPRAGSGAATTCSAMNEYTPEEEEAWKAMEEAVRPPSASKQAVKLSTMPLPLPGVISFGDYTLWDVDDKTFGITHADGEMMTASKEEFEAHISAFFGLNF